MGSPNLNNLFSSDAGESALYAGLAKLSAFIVGLCMLYMLYNVVVVVQQTIQGSDTAVAVDGELDLTRVDLSQDLPQRLSGEWRFYPNRFVVDEKAFSDSAESIFVPSSWDHQGFEPGNYGTYQLRVNLNRAYQDLALFIPTVGTAYALYVNGNKVDEVGEIATQEQAFEPAYDPKVILLKHPPTEQLTITLQVASYGFAWGGLWKNPLLGTPDSVLQGQLTNAIRSISIAAIFFAIALLNLLHFSLHPKEISPFLLSLVCLCFGLREVDTSELLYISNIIDIDFVAASRINFLTFYLALPILAAYCHKVFPREFTRPMALAIYVVSGVFSLSALATPPSWFSHYMPFFQFFTLLCIPYFLYAISLAAYRKRTGAIPIAVGAYILSVMVINDILYALDVIHTAHMASLGLLAFAVCQNYLTYIRFSHAEEENRHLSQKANQDSLTKLLNRRGLMQQVKQMESLRADYSLMILDFDHFKQLNDELGHDAGDKVLSTSGKIILATLRKQDLAARWGGEEFVVLLPDANLADAVKVADKLRVKLNTVLSDALSHPVSASFGVAERALDESFSSCLKRADKALYEAKQLGRNRVSNAS